MFHLSSLALLPIYFLSGREYSFSFYVLCFLFSLVMAIFIPRLMLYIISFFSSGFEFAAHKFNYYVGGISDEIFNLLMLPSILYRGILFFLFLFSFKIWGKSRFDMSKKDIWLYLNNFFLSLIIFNVVSVVPSFATRFSATSYYSFYFIYDKLLGYRFNKWIRLLFFILAAILSFNSLIETIYYSSGNTYLPYKLLLIEV